MKNLLRHIPVIATCLLSTVLHAQVSSGQLGGGELNTIKTAVSFLTIAPDAAAGGMGDLGVASSPDVFSQHWNIAKYSFADGRGGFALSWFEWIPRLISDVNYFYSSGFYRIGEKNVVSTSARYFSLGNIVYTNIYGTPLGSYEPAELAIDAGFSRKFTDHFAGGMAIRYIRSDLTSGQHTAGGQRSFPGQSVAADLGVYYQDGTEAGILGMDWAIGTMISNIGTPVSYTEDMEKTPIPTNLGIGGRFGVELAGHALTLMLEANKLLVPTPPVYQEDTATGEFGVIRGMEPPVSVIGGMFQSFYDAPGERKEDGTYSTFLEEMHEIRYSIGAEYCLLDLLSLRGGYFHEHATKGNRKYLTAGLGVHNRIASLNASYLFPAGRDKETTLEGTFRLSLSIILGAGT